jgi:hypothetical protein
LNRNKETLFSELALASKVIEHASPNITEAITELQPRPPPARSLNASICANGSISSTSPKQRFYTAAKKMLPENSHSNTDARTTPTSQEQLHYASSSPLQRIMKSISQSPDQDPSASVSKQSNHVSDLRFNDTVSAHADELFNIQLLKLEVQAMESWLVTKVCKIDQVFSILRCELIHALRNLSRMILKRSEGRGKFSLRKSRSSEIASSSFRSLQII